MKGADAKPGAFDGFQKLLWNDHIGVDIDQRHGGRNGGEFFEFFH